MHDFVDGDVKVKLMGENELLVEAHSASSSLTFRRSFSLPESIDITSITSVMSSDGILTITASKKVLFWLLLYFLNAFLNILLNWIQSVEGICILNTPILTNRRVKHNRRLLSSPLASWKQKITAQLPGRPREFLMKQYLPKECTTQPKRRNANTHDVIGRISTRT